MRVFWKIILQNPYRCRKMLVFFCDNERNQFKSSEIRHRHRNSGQFFCDNDKKYDICLNLGKITWQ